MLPELLPYHSYDPNGNVFIQVDGSLGIAWEIDPVESEASSQETLGSLARGIEGSRLATRSRSIPSAR